MRQTEVCQLDLAAWEQEDSKLDEMEPHREVPVGDRPWVEVVSRFVEKADQVELIGWELCESKPESEDKGSLWVHELVDAFQVVTISKLKSLLDVCVGCCLHELLDRRRHIAVVDQT